MKQSKIVIKDARRKGGKGYRVQSVAKNGEVLQSSQVLNTVDNVRKHVEAMSKCWDSFAISNPLADDRNFIDLTKDQKFFKKGWAKSGIDNKKLV